MYDGELGRTEGLQSRHAWPWVGLTVLTAFLASLLVWGRRAATVTAWLSVWLCASLALTTWVERLGAPWPNVIRGVLFATSNGFVIHGAFKFKRLAPTFEAHLPLALSVFPGWLLVSYSTNTQVESYCVLCVLAALLALPALRQQLTAQRLGHLMTLLVILVFSFAALSLAGTKASDVRPVFFATHALAGTVVAGLTLLGGLLWLVPSRQQRGLSRSAIVMFCFVAQHCSLHAFGRVLCLATTLAALACTLARRVALATSLALASYAWVARDYEWLVLVPALVIADCVGQLSAATKGNSSIGHVLPDAVHVTFLFALSTLLRIGLQGGLQLETLDLTVGSFGDAHMPHWVNAALLLDKFLLAQWLLLAVYLQHYPSNRRVYLLQGLGTAQLARGVCLLLMLFVCGMSYWTAFRVVADLPFAWLALAGVVLATGSLHGRSVATAHR